jgi:secreted Zn-dependent insulinase-like peptidase
MSEEVTTDHWTREGNYEVLQDDIEKAATDKRLYRAIRLQNGLIIVLVHDPGAHKAGAALNVAVGHMSDPVCYTTCARPNLINA